VFAGMAADMTRLVARYDERETAAIVDYLRRTIEILRTHTRRLTDEPS
jgi:hypothetical protein